MEKNKKHAASPSEIDDLRRRITELRHSAAELDATISAIAEGVIVYAPDGNILRMNPCAEHIFGYSSGEIQRSLTERLEVLQLQTPDGQSISEKEAPPSRALRGETFRGQLLVLHRPPDRTVWISASGAPIKLWDGRQAGAVVTISDITAIHNIEEQRTEILRAVSHDLRTPLTVALGHAQLLRHDPQRAGLTQEGIRSVVVMEAELRRLNSMIEELVIAIRLESGQIPIERQPVQIESFIDDLLANNKATLDRSRIEVNIPAKFPAVSADPDQLERIFLNLLTNALKFSPPNSKVTIQAGRVDNQANISVTDRGIGIPAKDILQIFERFYRGTTERQPEGLGLGLFTTKTIVEAHGGKITVKSKPGEGSTFTFSLSLA